MKTEQSRRGRLPALLTRPLKPYPAPASRFAGPLVRGSQLPVLLTFPSSDFNVRWLCGLRLSPMYPGELFMT